MSALDDTFSENEDDPQVYESSGDEWSSASEKKRNNRRASQRLSKKPRVTHADTSESESESDSEPKARNGVNKKQKFSGAAKYSAAAAVAKRNANSNVTVNPPADFVNGSFLILKKDAQSGDPNKHPCIWRIDGKALLQKYEPFEDDGMIRHKNTSIYTGWSALDKDLYAPVTVKVHTSSSQKVIVDLDWEKLKQINNIDSD